MPTRRSFLTGLAATSGLLGLPASVLAAPATDKRLVVVLLRGGADGLALVPPHGDPHYARARGELALGPPTDADGVVDLDGFFGLHPALVSLLPFWEAGQLAAVHAAGLPYGGRSHFDAQDLLENGTSSPRGAKDGWLARAVSQIGGEAFAIGSSVPLILRGAEGVSSIDPARAFGAEPDFVEEVSTLYSEDPLLGPALEEGLALRGRLPEMSAGSSRRRRRGFAPVAAGVGALLQEQGGVAVIDASGWDTHIRQEGGLTGRLGSLATGLEHLANALAPVWEDTVVAVVTEFGRTVAPNGTGGSDHGTASASLLLGGGVRGGKVYADWPGLRDKDLWEGRDLATTTDLRALFAAMSLHLGARELDRVLPDFEGASLDCLI